MAVMVIPENKCPTCNAFGRNDISQDFQGLTIFQWIWGLVFLSQASLNRGSPNKGS